MKAKICGVKDEKTLRFILDHKYPPDFIGFISNFPKSKRFIEIDKLKYLTNINRKNAFNDTIRFVFYGILSQIMNQSPFSYLFFFFYNCPIGLYGFF